MLSFSLLPILLSNTEQPTIGYKIFYFKRIYILSPLGFISALIIGLAHSALFGFGAVYVSAKSFSLFEISIFIVTIYSFGALAQWPIGYISDKIDRRIILIAITFVASGLSIFIVISSYLSFILFIILSEYFLLCLFPMLSVAVAHVNDFLESNEIISASSTFNILIGVGSILGPILVSSSMTLVGPNGFFIYLFLVHGTLGLFGLYRMARRVKPRDLESQYIPLPRNISAAGMEMNPVIEPAKED